ncbi:hypothetical protein FK529_07090 [Tsukamurella asaccharolytica]|uniref:PE-PPE domain-containing protein n=1 Tax=Tsukamurella asaccharolytica TaxID=2592067 RepID=A0A5C5R9S5_9ACTN|nr:hypothetical protein [Tsukamurella asaccharolytica]TWS19907.1 hypothetical protein FK529_07090 [Tsukamurella asaccharolytica]
MATAAATGVLTATAPAQVAMAGSVVNIPANIIQGLANIPASHIAGVDKTSDALELGGNWWLYTPGNVLGYDQADVAKIDGLMALLVPFPAVAQALADPINVTFQANFPMTESCTGAPAPCADPTYWTAYFKVMPWKLIQGVTYGTVLNTVDPSIEMPWSNSTQRINLFGVPQAVWESLTKDPEGFKAVPSLEQAVNAYLRLVTATFNSLNPVVEGTYCLPCQALGVKGAPGSLSRIPLFGNWYTVTDFGQEFTDDNWVGRPEGVPLAPDVDALSLWSPEGQARLWKDIDATYQRLLAGDNSDLEKAWGSFEKVFSGFGALVPEPGDLGGTINAITGDFTTFIDSITSTVTLPSSGASGGAPQRTSAGAAAFDGPEYSSEGDGYQLSRAASESTVAGTDTSPAPSYSGKHRAPDPAATPSTPNASQPEVAESTSVAPIIAQTPVSVGDSPAGTADAGSGSGAGGSGEAADGGESTPGPSGSSDSGSQPSATSGSSSNTAGSTPSSSGSGSDASPSTSVDNGASDGDDADGAASS